MLSSQTKDAMVLKAMQNLRREDDLTYDDDDDDDSNNNDASSSTSSSTRSSANGLTVASIVAMDPTVLNTKIYSVGFRNNKTKYIKQVAHILHETYNDDVPATAAAMIQELPGVGPKMAYIVENLCWQRQTGIGVDTHMQRLFPKLGWVSPATKTPEQTRRQLESWLPHKYWGDVNLLWVGFGQEVQQERQKSLYKALSCHQPLAALRLLHTVEFDFTFRFAFVFVFVVAFIFIFVLISLSSPSSSSSLIPCPRSNSGVTGTGRMTASVQVVPLLLLLLLLFGVAGAAGASAAVAVTAVEEMVTPARLLRFVVVLVVPGPLLLLLLLLLLPLVLVAVLLLPRFWGSVALPMNPRSRSGVGAWNNRTPPFRGSFSVSLLPILRLRRRHELVVLLQVGDNWLSGDMGIIAVVVVLLLLVGVVGNNAIVQGVGKVDLLFLLG